MNHKKLISQLEKHRDAIGKERDKLRELISEWEDLEYTCGEALVSIQEAIDKLSELT